MDLRSDRLRDELHHKDSTSNHKKKRKRSRSNRREQTPSLILNGKILSISTCDQDSKDEKTTQASHSYKAVHQLCKDLGAVVSSQVSTRVFGVLCTPCAVKKCTQRVRKVLQKQKSQNGLIHIKWLYDCQKENKCIDWKPYSLNKLGQEALVQYEENRKRACTHLNPEEGLEEDHMEDSNRTRNQVAMREEVTIALDCCCVCHDTDRDDCPYCFDCNVNQAKKVKTRR